MVFNYSIFNSLALSFFKLTKSCCCDKFTVLVWYSQILFKFISNSIYFKFASNSLPICLKLASNSSQIHFRIGPLSEHFLKICFKSFRKTFLTFQFISNLLQKQINPIRNEDKFGDNPWKHIWILQKMLVDNGFYSSWKQNLLISSLNKQWKLSWGTPLFWRFLVILPS